MGLEYLSPDGHLRGLIGPDYLIVESTGFLEEAGLVN